MKPILPVLERCMTEPVEDNRCRGLQRYYYNNSSMSCVPFSGDGACPARGNNKNNFADKMECEKICKSFIVESKYKKKIIFQENDFVFFI
jgi:hypothetical protein